MELIRLRVIDVGPDGPRTIDGFATPANFSGVAGAAAGRTLIDPSGQRLRYFAPLRAAVVRDRKAAIRPTT